VDGYVEVMLLVLKLDVAVRRSGKAVLGDGSASLGASAS